MTDAMDRVIEAKLTALARFKKEVVDKVAALGSLEKMFGKPIEQFMPQELMLANQIDPQQLEKRLFNLKYEQVTTMEQQLGGK